MECESISPHFNFQVCSVAMYSKLPMRRKLWQTALVGELMSGAGCAMASFHAAVGWTSESLKVRAGLSASQNVLPSRSSWNRNARLLKAGEQKRLRYDDAATAYFQASP